MATQGAALRTCGLLKKAGENFISPAGGFFVFRKKFFLSREQNKKAIRVNSVMRKGQKEGNTMKDKTALCAAMDAHGDMVYRLALCHLGTKSDAEDVYQDVFLRLFRDDTVFRDDHHLKAWLIRVTVNCCTDLHRSAWFQKSAPLEEWSADTAPVPEDYADLWNAVAALPEELRTVIYLHYVEGYQTDEIASMLRCRPATVRTRLHRARNKLKLKLEEDT